MIMNTLHSVVIFRGNNFFIEHANELGLNILSKDKRVIGKPLSEAIAKVEEQIKPILDKCCKAALHLTQMN
jgi:hypothetical protein